MFEITSDDVALLNDEDLRSLVGRLCESEMRRRGISPSCVTWGGDQRAADGGVDVRVALPPNIDGEGFIPRPDTGFQVKAEDMQAAKIRSEMRPNGAVRSSIRELAEKSGAYIIVSSKGSTSDLPLQNRREAMRGAISDIPNPDAATVDFYDRTRIATWVRDHAGLIPWVREKIGKPFQGWYSYGAWAFSPEGVEDEYLLDDKVRVRVGAETPVGGLKALDGLKRIRDRLTNAGTVVRLVGLSGMGKTRLVQALFDVRVGEGSLDPSLACYTNMMEEPDPAPAAVAAHLIAARLRAILIIDNCPPELHRRLSEICRSPGSLVSLVTVEYDIRDDQPEGTEVFSLEPASADLIGSLVTRRFPHISPVDARSIAEFSGGNARIAIALADTIGKNDTIAGLTDESLFTRLFQQRQGESEPLLLAAQTLALVYSFQGEDTSEDSELCRLGKLIGRTPQEMYRSVAELRRRDLVQQRGVWRAVLPQAIANRLAKAALQDISFSDIKARLIDGAPERLLKSFSRRLGYLHGSNEAKSIVAGWLGPDGLLNDIVNLNEYGIALFNNVAPVAPEVTLAAFERVLLGTEDADVIRGCRRYARLLRSLAYDASLFERSVELILKVAEFTNVDDDANEAARVFASLFPIYFSGTDARIDQRLAVIASLVGGDSSKRRRLGLMAMRAMLETSHFSPGYNFEFGAHSRGYGYSPRSRDDIKDWFSRALEFAGTTACSGTQSGAEVSTLIAEGFRGLWSGAAMYESLENVCRAIRAKRFWSEGWIAVRQTIYYDSRGFTPETSNRLRRLEEFLRPGDLPQEVRSKVLSEAVMYLGLGSSGRSANDIERNREEVETNARDLGKAVAADRGAFAELLPDLVTGRAEQLWSFGAGLADGAADPNVIWNGLVTELAAQPKQKQSPVIFLGFLNALKGANATLVDALLDDAVENDLFAEWYPVLQTGVGINKQGFERLLRSLALGRARIGTYRSLVAGGVTHTLTGGDFNALLMRIAKVPGGLEIAIEILCMRLSYARTQSSPSELIGVGCELMRQLTFARRSTTDEYRLGIIAENCLVGEEGATAVWEVCGHLKEAVSKYETYAFYHADLLKILFRVQPLAALEGFCGGSQADFRLGTDILDQAAQMQRNPFDAIPDADLLDWCDRQPEIRYPAIAAGVTPFQASAENGSVQWTNIARALLDRAPGRVAVLRKFTEKFVPSGWTGSLAATIGSNMKLLDDLTAYPDPALVEFIAQERVRLTGVINAERQTEVVFQRETDDRFE